MGQIVEYSWPSVHEVAFLENLWRARARTARIVSLSLVFWRRLPSDVIGLIAAHMWDDSRVRDVVPRSPPHAPRRTYEAEVTFLGRTPSCRRG